MNAALLRHRWPCRAACLALGASLVLGCAAGGATPTPAPPPIPVPARATATEALAAPAPTLRGPTPTPASDLAATVNGAPITKAEVAARLAQTDRALQSADAPPLSVAEQRAALAHAREQVLAELIEEHLILQAAAERGITASEAEVDAALAEAVAQRGGQGAFDAWLAERALSAERYREMIRFGLIAAALREALAAEVPAQQEQRRARHILTATAAEATALLAELEAGADFATLARTRSIDPGTRAAGGDLGFLPRGLLGAELDGAIWALAPGETSGVVESPFGYHIVHLDAVDPDRPLDLGALQTLQASAFEQWLAAQRRAADLWVAPPSDD